MKFKNIAIIIIITDAATEAITAGHNCCILGQADTGKHLLLQAAAKLKPLGKTVYCTASTGIAAANIGGVTIHKFAGK